jgi:hypothetical protein
VRTYIIAIEVEEDVARGTEKVVGLIAEEPTTLYPVVDDWEGMVTDG